MARTRNISAVISLKDNMSATLREIRREQKQFQRELRISRKEVEAQNAKELKIRLNSTLAHKKLSQLRKELAPLRQKYIAYTLLKDSIGNKVKTVKSDLKSIGKFVAKPIITVKDSISSKLGKIKSTLLTMQGMAVAVGVGAGAKALLQSGGQLEAQQISMEHFMGVGNKGKSSAEIKSMSASYVKNLRENANSTPFETGEVLSVGARALQLSNGNAKEAMKQVKLAEDMAAMNPGKSVSDAMEALADAQVGEMERLKEFGLKASSTDSYESVQGKLGEMYGGGANKLANSGLGMASTISGKAKSMVSDMGLGVLEKLKPVMGDIIKGMDDMAPGIQRVSEGIGTAVGGVINFIRAQMPTIQPIFTSVISIVQSLAPVFSAVFTAIQPVLTGFFSITSSVFSGIASVVQVVAPHVTSLIQRIQPAISNVGSVLQSMGRIFSSVFSTVKKVVKGALDFISPIISKIAGLVNSVSGAISSVASFVTGGSGVDQNATGTSYFRGGWTTVGENGPELMHLPSGSKILSNSDSKELVKKSSSSQNVSSTSQVVVKIEKLAENIYTNSELENVADSMIEIIMTKLKKVGYNAVLG